MKKVYLIFLLSSTLSLLLISFLKDKKYQYTNKEDINSLETLISDSITPNCSNKFEENMYNSLNNIKELKISIPESRKWSKNLFYAFRESHINKFDGIRNIISGKYKKNFDAYIYLNKYGDEICRFPSKIRISGDWNDHIQNRDNGIVSSLDVNLKKGNINGITKFKLFLPSTKNGSSEVFISLLMKEMGYLSPRTKILKVNLNNQSYEMIFQEKASKEMLENNKLRESAIVGIDESLIWESRKKKFGSYAGNIFPRVINKKWVKRNIINQKIGLEGLNKFSNVILESWNQGGVHGDITFSDNLLSNGNIKNKKILSRFKAHLLASGSDHALWNHNRRFYYDPINKSLIPIYYDGMSSITNPDKLKFNFNLYPNPDRFLTRDISTKDFEYAVNEINGIDFSNFASKLKNSGVEIEYSELIKIKNQLIKNLKYLNQNNQIKLETKFLRDPLQREIISDLNFGLIFYSRLDDNYYLCKIEQDLCVKKILNPDEINKILISQFFYNNLKYYFIGDKFDPRIRAYHNEDFNKLDLINVGENIYIKKFGEPKITLDKKRKLIRVELKNLNEKILIFNSLLRDWEIEVFANEINNYKKSVSRIDTNLLTSLVTIKDSEIENLRIHIEGGKLEDSLNIINSSGSIQKIDIRNSYQDSIDFDFSDLNVDEIKVANAGNDCIDVSAGQYYINKLNLNGCKDKGISSGEKSTLKVSNAEIKNTNLALVSKDLSKVIVKNAFLENNNLCVAAYKKKQEFGPSYISVPKKLCPKDKFAIQNFSTLEIK